MSKAFTKEDDQAPEIPPSRPATALPPGAKNYLTPAGAHRFRVELERLQELGPPPEPDRLQRVNDRIRELKRILRTASVVRPAGRPPDQVRFGTCVRVRRRAGGEICYRIVGVDEADPEGGSVSWLSPVAQALLHARTGDRVAFQIPEGPEEFEVISITWCANSEDPL